jgi:Zn-ribbon-containing, possibly RNA-binding protein and truncated derivatives
MSGIRRRREYPVAEALTSAVRELPTGDKVVESLAFAYWSRVVGPQGAAATDPESIRDGILFVRTKSSVWSHELSVMKAHLITELNRSIGRPVIKEIIFRAQGVKAKSPPTDTGKQPTEADLKLLRLPASELAGLQKELDALDSIPDERIRNAVSHRIVRETKLRWWRLQNGWKACARCSVPHNSKGDLCPICRLSP